MNKPLILILFLSLNLVGFSQSKFSLKDVIAIAHGESISSKKVQNTFENKYWQYFSYKRSFLPSLSFTGTIPALNVGITEVIKEDGTRDFVRTSNVNYSAAFQINQPIRWTGGDIFISTDLARLDILGGNNRTSYKASPFYIGYRQPIMKFNGYKWQSKIEPLEYEEAKKKSVEQNEDVSIEAVRLFFEVVNNSSRYDIAKINVANSDTLFKISRGRYNLGKIAESELLQIELTLLNAEKSLSQSELDVIVSKQKLKSFLGLAPTETLHLQVDETVPKVSVDIAKAIKLAKENRSEIVNFEKSLLQSKRDLEKAKKR